MSVLDTVIWTVLGLWGFGFALFALWLCMIRWNTNQQLKADREQIEKMNAEFARNYKRDRDESFLRVSAMLVNSESA